MTRSAIQSRSVPGKAAHFEADALYRAAKHPDRSTTLPSGSYLSAVDAFVEFWDRCKLQSPPFAHPDDLPALRAGGGKHADLDPRDFDSFIASPRFGDFRDARLHLSLLPTPFDGDLRHADIVLLLLNPGFTYMNYYAETRVPEFRRRLERALRQTLDGVEYPFMSLDPEFCWYSGFTYWETKLRDVIRIIADQKFQGRYLDALRDLSQRLAYVQLVPYHSPSFKSGGLLEKLPSADAARQFARKAFLLATAAGERKKTVIVTRRERDWGLPESKTTVVYRGALTRGMPLGTNSPGGRAILERYGVDLPGK